MNRQTFTTAGGVTLSYLAAGDGGTPIVLLHGITAGAATYGAIGDRLAENHRVFALDFRGHGSSDKIGGPYNAENYIADTVEFIEAMVGEEPVVLVGHSLGSVVAAMIAGRHAVPLRGVLLEDPPLNSGQSDGADGSDMITTIFTALQNLMKGHHEAGQSIEDLAALIAQGPAFGDLTKKNIDLVSEEDIAIQAMLMHQCDWHVLDVITGDEDIGFDAPANYLPNINVPVHVVVGNAAKGAVISESDFEMAKGLIPDSSGLLVSEVGHLIHEHAPETYWVELTTFLERVA
ncbi:MAG: alpha/beta hydrolase [Alphaproteobacteria bacterium]